MKCTQDPSRASLQFIWTLYYQIIVIAGGREGGRFFFVTNLWWDFMFSFVWESCNYLWFSCKPPKKVIQVEIPELKNFCCKIHFKWKMSSSNITNEPTPRGDFRNFICISNEKYVSIYFIHNSLCFSFVLHTLVA